MKPGSKYYPLFEYLKRSDQSMVTLSLSQIEAILKTALPASARSKRAWWSNRDSLSALQARAWVQASYHTKIVNLEKETIVFEKFQAQYNIQRSETGLLWNQDAIKALRKHMGLTQAKFAEEMGVRRQTVSEWENGVYGPDRSTTKHLELIAKQHWFEDLGS